MSTFLRPSADRAVIRCDQCPGRPVLATHREETDTRRCVRCQGEHRWLAQPHPEDHLCAVCRRECPGCQAPTSNGERCRACRDRCRTCAGPLPQRPAYASGVTHVEPGKRRDRRRKWARTYFPRSWDRDQCDACQTAASARDPLRAVLAALPDKLVLACGGAVPPAVVDLVHDELQRHPAARIAARVERRWWQGWAGRPLRRDGDGRRDGYGPDDVAVWLLTPTACNGRCEDGWLPAPPERPDRDDVPCPVCRGGWLLSSRRDEPAADDEGAEPKPAAARSLADAVSYRPPIQECAGRGGTCGRPVTSPHTQCPECLDWPWCVCGRRRRNPDRAACPACSTS
ncbi:hypothetical protein [Streptomyces rimosus]|uniref:hypothetical protein n=1 Tax=Streptomyces rimosus TaxID=1927 RepID=UPI0004C68980|nr:hypothetical protein [Streptomyces rimosus]